MNELRWELCFSLTHLRYSGACWWLYSTYYGARYDGVSANVVYLKIVGSSAKIGVTDYLDINPFTAVQNMEPQQHLQLRSTPHGTDFDGGLRELYEPQSGLDEQ